MQNRDSPSRKLIFLVIYFFFVGSFFRKIEQLLAHRVDGIPARWAGQTNYNLRFCRIDAAKRLPGFETCIDIFHFDKFFFLHNTLLRKIRALQKARIFTCSHDQLHRTRNTFSPFGIEW